MKWRKLLITIALLFIFQMCYDNTPEEKIKVNLLRYTIKGRFTIYPSDYHDKRIEEIIKNFPDGK